MNGKTQDASPMSNWSPTRGHHESPTNYHASPLLKAPYTALGKTFKPASLYILVATRHPTQSFLDIILFLAAGQKHSANRLTQYPSNS